MAYTALYDACILYPAPLRDLLVQLARTGLFRGVWTERIHDEWIRSLIRHRPALNPTRLRRTANLMNEAVENCLVANYEPLVEGLTLPDADDRHVLAAAIAGRADVIVTFNLADFPAAPLALHGIKAQHPDSFIRHVLSLDPKALGAVRACRMRLKNPPRGLDDYLETLLRQGLPETVTYLQDWASLI